MPVYNVKAHALVSKDVNRKSELISNGLLHYIQITKPKNSHPMEMSQVIDKCF